MIKFIEQYQVVINILVGITAGIVISIVGFFISHRFNWRNILTKEFTVRLRETFRQVNGSNITRLGLIFEINCTNSDELSINYTFLKLPKKVTGNTPPNPTVAEVMFGNRGRLYLHEKSLKFQYSSNGKYTIEDARILDQISKGEITKLTLVVNSNKYGDVKSNSLKLKKSWFQKMIGKSNW